MHPAPRFGCLSLAGSELALEDPERNGVNSLPSGSFHYVVSWLRNPELQFSGILDMGESEFSSQNAPEAAPSRTLIWGAVHKHSFLLSPSVIPLH
jgi:hypothetical protein